MHLPAKKALGQNFLVDERVISRLMREIAPRDGETIVEIGSGRGALTSCLLELAGKVVAIEFDRDLIPLLHERFAYHPNFVLLHEDALAADFCSAIKPAITARVVANLPYNISTAILQRLIEQRRCLSEMILMLQREVVERIMAPPATHERGYLTVVVEAYCEAEKLLEVAPESFRPKPKVWSAVVRLRTRAAMAVQVTDERLFRELVSAGFAQRRKTIMNNLRAAPRALLESVERAGGAAALLNTARIEPQRRAETLTIGEWGALARALEGTVL